MGLRLATVKGMTRRAILQNPCGKSLVVESAFDKIALKETLDRQLD